MEKHLVVARYDENLDWISSCCRTFVYNKGLYSNWKFHESIISLPNIGRETHTYLYHIVTNYHQLADLNYFVQGNPFPHTKGILFLLEQSSLQDMLPYVLPQWNLENWEKGCIALGDTIWDYDMENTDIWNRDWRNPFIKQIYQKAFSSTLKQRYLPANYGNQFVLSRDLIRAFPLGVYKFLLQEHQKNWSLPWALEYCWLHLWSLPEQPTEFQEKDVVRMF